ncbi:putative membrane lipoprotein [Perilla frutescens var. hirtella]|nr:putative membrane lipoprotein [Perilla frutescens var. hirtella]
MIIKNLFRRYERWNPVHPTYGAFWGMGIGIGCGIGWGPGFGPEVIGYVGAGCGAGFSVGITFLGLGIGLPANYLIQLPYSGFMITRSWGARAAGDISSHHNPFPTISNWRENIIECSRKHITDCFRRLREQFGPNFFSNRISIRCFKIEIWGLLLYIYSNSIVAAVK